MERLKFELTGQGERGVLTEADRLRLEIALRGYVVFGDQVPLLFWQYWQVAAHSYHHPRFPDAGFSGSRTFHASGLDLACALGKLLRKIREAEE